MLILLAAIDEGYAAGLFGVTVETLPAFRKELGLPEDVGTLEEHRGRGYASAVVLHAAELARRAGADFVFLVADAQDWPQHLYRRLGFEPIGHYVKLISPAV